MYKSDLSGSIFLLPIIVTPGTPDMGVIFVLVIHHSRENDDL